MSLHDTNALIVETSGAAQSLPDPTTVTDRTHILVNTGTATVTWSSTGATPFTESGSNVASITLVPGAVKSVRSNGTRWAVSPVAAGTGAAPSGGTVPGEWSNYGLLGWSWDIAEMANNLTYTGDSGKMMMTRMIVPNAMTISNLHIFCDVAGTLTGAYGALYNSSGVLLSQSASVHGTWSTGLKAFPLGAPQVVAAGQAIYCAFWFVFSSAPGFWRTTAQVSANNNAGLSTPNLRFCSANTGLTTTAPANFTQVAGSAFAYCNWVGIS